MWIAAPVFLGAAIYERQLLLAVFALSCAGIGSWQLGHKRPALLAFAAAAALYQADQSSSGALRTLGTQAGMVLFLGISALGVALTFGFKPRRRR